MSKLLPTAVPCAAVLLLAACGTAVSSSASAPASSASASVAAVASSPDCADQVRAWATTGGGATLPAFSADTSALGKSLTALAADQQAGADTSGDASAVQTSVACMQSDAEALEASPGPSCLAGLAPNVSAAARYYSTAAIDADNSVNQMSAGDGTAATGDLQAATAVAHKGNAKLGAADTAVKNFNAGS